MVLQEKVSPNTRNIMNETPRDVAARLGNNEACQVLGQAETGLIPSEAEQRSRDQVRLGLCKSHLTTASAMVSRQDQS